MQLDFTLNATLPRLAWCAEVRPDGGVTVEHGPWVEVHPDGFVEGAWDGDFSARDFDQAGALMGSGGKRLADGVLFCTPDHTLDRLFSVNLRGRIWISNSLVFLLARTGLRLSPSYPYYLLDFRSVFRGLRRCATEFPTASGARIRLHYLCNVMVTPGPTLTERPKPAARDFRDYREYEGFLVDTLARIGRNAIAPGRVQTYRWLSSVSAGYDSAAAAALAQKAGGTTVITLNESRTLTGVSAIPDDSGAPIARHLGLPVVEFPTVAYRQAPLTTFAEFAAAGDAGDVQFSAMEAHLAGTLFTGGFQGDHMWTRTTEPSDDDIVRGDPAGSSLGEFRLRVGFIIVAPAFFAARNLAAVRRIGNAPEMAPWTLGTAYDRPIPRRILEVAGVPRTAFGQRKRATAIWSDHLLRDRLIDDALAEWTRVQTPRASAVARRLHDLFYFGVTRWWERYNAAVDRYGRLPHVTCPLPVRHQAALGRWGDVLVQWGVDQVTPRYAALPPGAVAGRHA